MTDEKSDTQENESAIWLLPSVYRYPRVLPLPCRRNWETWNL